MSGQQQGQVQLLQASLPQVLTVYVNRLQLAEAQIQEAQRVAAGVVAIHLRKAIRHPAARVVHHQEATVLLQRVTAHPLVAAVLLLPAGVQVEGGHPEVLLQVQAAVVVADASTDNTTNYFIL